LDVGFGEIVGFGGGVEEPVEDFWGVEEAVDVGADDWEVFGDGAVGPGVGGWPL
jgi:hypothetical protein